jgi:hypothetical protein
MLLIEESAMKQFLKIAQSGQWYGFVLAEDAEVAMQQHEENKFLFPDFARRYPGAYLLREATPDALPPALRRVIEAIDQQNWPEFWQALEQIDR